MPKQSLSRAMIPCPAFRTDDCARGLELAPGSYGVREDDPTRIIVPALCTRGDLMHYLCPFCTTLDPLMRRGKRRVVVHQHGIHWSEAVRAKLEAPGGAHVEHRVPHCYAEKRPDHSIFIVVGAATPRLQTFAEQKRLQKDAQAALCFGPMMPVEGFGLPAADDQVASADVPGGGAMP